MVVDEKYTHGELEVQIDIILTELMDIRNHAIEARVRAERVETKLSSLMWIFGIFSASIITMILIFVFRLL